MKFITEPAPKPKPEHPAVTEARRHLTGAWYAKMAYHDKKELKEQLKDPSFEYFENLAFAGYAVLDGNEAVISFRGTMFPGSENMKADLEFWPRGKPGRHSGFLTGWEALSSSVENWLGRQRPAKVSLHGHSLGGAIALLAASQLAKKWTIEQVVVFGCPRVGGWRFRSLYVDTPAGPDAKRRLQDVTVRYVLGTDLISRLPPPIYFSHVGKPVYVSEDGYPLAFPMPLLIRTVESSFPGTLPASTDEPPPMSYESALVVISRAFGPLFGWGYLPFWLTFGLAMFACGRLAGHDVRYHFAKKYETALSLWVQLIEANPGLFPWPLTS